MLFFLRILLLRKTFFLAKLLKDIQIDTVSRADSKYVLTFEMKCRKTRKNRKKPYGFEILITPDPEVWASLGKYTSTRHMLENIFWKFQLERTLAKISALTILNTSLVHVHAKIVSIIFSLEKWLKQKIFLINRKLRCSAFIIY